VSCDDALSVFHLGTCWAQSSSHHRFAYAGVIVDGLAPRSVLFQVRNAMGPLNQ
jgi:hypothetical protein